MDGREITYDIKEDKNDQPLTIVYEMVGCFTSTGKWAGMQDTKSYWDAGTFNQKI